MILGVEAEDIERAIAKNAQRDGQFATAFALLKVAEALNNISSTVGYEGMIARRNAGESVSTQLSNIASGLEHVADAISGVDLSSD